MTDSPSGFHGDAAVGGAGSDMSRAPRSGRHVALSQVAKVVPVPVPVLAVIVVVVKARHVTGRCPLLRGSQTPSCRGAMTSRRHDITTYQAIQSNKWSRYRANQRLSEGRAHHVEARDGHLEHLLLIGCKTMTSQL